MIRLALMGGGLVLLNGCGESDACRRARQQNLPNRDEVCRQSHGGSTGVGSAWRRLGSTGSSDGGGDHAVSRGGFGGSDHGIG